MKKKLWLVCISVSIISCGEGSIEKRNVTNGCYREHLHTNFSTGVYLVNTSSSEKITFSVKKTTHNPKLDEEPSIRQYTLFPGDETYLGCDEYREIHNHYSSQDTSDAIRINYSIVGQLVIPATAD